MTDIPILFSAPMIRALIEGRKTMTRRLAWNRKKANADPLEDMGERDANKDEWRRFAPSRWQKVQPGDRLWVRENFYYDDNGDREFAVYAANERAAKKHLEKLDAMVRIGFPKQTADRLRKLRPAIHMPRAFSRLTLQVTSVKVEKLQAIPLLDVRAEGCEVRHFWLFGANAAERQAIGSHVFRGLWESLHGPKSWAANPEVVAISFAVHKVNIDRMREAA